MAALVTVVPKEFSFVEYDAGEIGDLVTDLAARLDVSGPIRVEVDETTPLGKMSSFLDDGDVSGDTAGPTVVLRFQSGALEDTKHLQHFDRRHATSSIGRVLLRARDRRRPDFADVPPDAELTNAQTTAWDVYCAGRLARLGVEVNQQAYRYDFRNRFGFSDDVDARFDELWAADDLGWHQLPGVD